jgi:hypothetical protein
MSQTPLLTNPSETPIEANALSATPSPADPEEAEPTRTHNSTDTETTQEDAKIPPEAPETVKRRQQNRISQRAYRNRKEKQPSIGGRATVLQSGAM